MRQRAESRGSLKSVQIRQVSVSQIAATAELPFDYFFFFPSRYSIIREILICETPKSSDGCSQLPNVQSFLSVYNRQTRVSQWLKVSGGLLLKEARQLLRRTAQEAQNITSDMLRTFNSFEQMLEKKIRLK